MFLVCLAKTYCTVLRYRNWVLKEFEIFRHFFDPCSSWLDIILICQWKIWFLERPDLTKMYCLCNVWTFCSSVPMSFLLERERGSSGGQARAERATAVNKARYSVRRETAARTGYRVYQSLTAVYSCIGLYSCTMGLTLTVYFGIRGETGVKMSKAYTGNWNCEKNRRIFTSYCVQL